MPATTKRLTELREGAEDGELPYISKSRLKTYISCPRKFYYNYILGIRSPENFHMKKGSRIHLTFEKYYENLLEYHQDSFTDDLPETPDDIVRFLPDDGYLWIDWMKPYIGNFISWELERASNVSTTADWLPVGIEAEAWNSDAEGPPWMGFADVIIPARSVPDVSANGKEDVVIVDFKTGKTPDEKYRDEGIYLEGEYYGMLFEDEFQVEGVAGYFPKNDDFIVSPLSEDRREMIFDKIREIAENGQEKKNFETSTSPLCKYGPGDDEQCTYYSMCKAGKEWGAPTERWEEFVEDVEDGVSTGKLKEKYWDDDQDAESVYYWQYKA